MRNALRALVIWYSTAFSVMPSSAAISLLLIPLNLLRQNTLSVLSPRDLRVVSSIFFTSAVNRTWGSHDSRVSIRNCNSSRADEFISLCALVFMHSCLRYCRALFLIMENRKGSGIWMSSPAALRSQYMDMASAARDSAA